MTQIEQVDADLEKVRERLQQRLADLESELQPLQEQAARVRVQLDLIAKALKAGDKGSDQAAATVAAPSARTAIPEVIQEILKEAAQPLHVSEIRNRYIAKGLTVPGQGTESNLLVYIVRNPMFTRVSKGTYALADGELPKEVPAKPRTKRRRRKK